jgi:LPXTG-site transpeptidase (sortase) family protein
MKAGPVRRFVGWMLVGIGCLALLASGGVLLWARLFQEQQALVLPAIPTVERKAAPPAAGQLLGLLQVPRLELSSVVIEGDDSAALLLAVGHLSDTPLPWHEGNSVLAAHRDTFFRPLKGIRQGDVIRFTTADAELEYVVRQLRVVEPTAVEVLDSTPSPTLTLITCFPFDYIGSAPKRFIVTAERQSRTAFKSSSSLAPRPVSMTSK